MANPLVTPTEAVAHLRIPAVSYLTPGDAADLTLKIAQSSDAIRDYLKGQSDDAWDETTAPTIVKAATLFYLAHLYEHRGDDLATFDAAVWESIGRVLWRMRDPALR